MREHKIRRLPVLNADHELEGILSMNDIVLKANGKAKESQIVCECSQDLSGNL
jgi:CBS domain-containing protein